MEKLEIIDRVKKGKYTAEIVQMEQGLYLFRVYSDSDSIQYVARCTKSIQTAYSWLVRELVEW